MKVGAAAAYAGGVNPKTLYAAVQRGDLKAARIGAGRNVLFCEAWIDEWLGATASAGRGPAPQKSHEAGPLAAVPTSTHRVARGRNADDAPTVSRLD